MQPNIHAFSVDFDIYFLKGARGKSLFNFPEIRFQFTSKVHERERKRYHKTDLQN